MQEGTVLTCCGHIMLHLVWTFNGFIFSSDFYCEGVGCEATIVIFNLLWMLLIFSDLYCESVGFEVTIVISDLLWMLLIFRTCIVRAWDLKRPFLFPACYEYYWFFQTCIVRAWDLKRPLLFAPAMNTFMWDHPLTGRQIDTLKSFGYKEIPCIRKKLACGDDGKFDI